MAGFLRCWARESKRAFLALLCNRRLLRDHNILLELA